MWVFGTLSQPLVGYDVYICIRYHIEDTHGCFYAPLQVGSDLTTAEAADLAEYAASNRQTAFVTLDWLRQCALQRERLPTGDGFCIPISALQGLRKKVCHAGGLMSAGG